MTSQAEQPSVYPEDNRHKPEATWLSNKVGQGVSIARFAFSRARLERIGNELAQFAPNMAWADEDGASVELTSTEYAQVWKYTRPLNDDSKKVIWFCEQGNHWRYTAEMYNRRGKNISSEAANSALPADEGVKRDDIRRELDHLLGALAASELGQMVDEG